MKKSFQDRENSLQSPLSFERAKAARELRQGVMFSREMKET